MKYKILGNNRLIYLVLALVLLLVSLVPTTMAQEPEEEGDVNAAFTLHGAPRLDPPSLAVAVALGGTSELIIDDIEDVASAQLVVDFPAGGPQLLEVTSVVPGNLLRDLVLGRDYQFTWCVVDGVACFDDPLLGIPIGSTPAGVDPSYGRLIINFVLFDHAPLLRGNGSLARITWGTTAVGDTASIALVWQDGNFRDRDGNQIYPCSILGFPPPGCVTFPLAGSVNIEAFASPIRAQVSFEGGKPEDGGTTLPATVIEQPGDVCTLDIAGTSSRWACPGPVPTTVTAARPGYLSAKATNVMGQDLHDIILPAGNVVTGGACEMINIADIAAIASRLNENTPTHADAGTAPEEMDFNNNQTVDISDLALTAKNYGLRGTVNWHTGQLSCP
jgi:hypothetical protein